MTQELTAEQIEAAFAADPGQTRHQKKCIVGSIIEEYPVLEPKIMDVAHVSAATVSRVLKNLGVASVGDKVVTKHRRGTCRCPKED